MNPGRVLFILRICLLNKVKSVLTQNAMDLYEY